MTGMQSVESDGNFWDEKEGSKKTNIELIRERDRKNQAKGLPPMSIGQTKTVDSIQASDITLKKASTE